MTAITDAVARLSGPGAPFEVVREEIHGVVQGTYRNRPTDLRQILAAARDHGGIEHLVQGTTRYSFEQTVERAQRVAGALYDDFGVRPGDRVGILAANAPDWVVAFWAGVILDAIVVPFNAWWKAEELAFGLEDSGTTLLFADRARAAVAEAAGFDSSRIVTWGGGGRVDMETLAAGAAAPLDLVEGRGEDATAAILYTSGTTGRPKGSANTTRNIVSNLMHVGLVTEALRQAAPETMGDPSAQVIELCVIPLFHVTALFSYVVPFAYGGAKLVFMPPGRFDAETAAHLIEQERVTRIGGVPTIVARIIESGVADRYDLSSIVSASYGGAPASPALMDKIQAAFPHLKHRVAQGYGLTETSAITTLNVGADYTERPASVGFPMPTCEIRIISESGGEAAPGESGEIWIRGSNVIPGYWNRPEANRDSFVDGFLRTGDVGYLDADGFLYITDRAKDMIIRGGENVYSVEVEAVLEGHPAVSEVAVVPVPDPDLGERVKAIVVASRPVDSQALAAYAAEHLASFKVPEVWEFRSDPLPRNPSGKVLKPALRGGSSVFAVGEESDSAL